MLILSNQLFRLIFKRYEYLTKFCPRQACNLYNIPGTMCNIRMTLKASSFGMVKGVQITGASTVGVLDQSSYIYTNWPLTPSVVPAPVVQMCHAKRKEMYLSAQPYYTSLPLVVNQHFNINRRVPQISRCDIGWK